MSLIFFQKYLGNTDSCKSRIWWFVFVLVGFGHVRLGMAGYTGCLSNFSVLGVFEN